MKKNLQSKINDVKYGITKKQAYEYIKTFLFWAVMWAFFIFLTIMINEALFARDLVLFAYAH